jgi:hypothetical protein
VAGAVLDDGITGFKEDFGAIVEDEIDLAGEDDVEVDGVGGVHAGVHGFENVGHAREFGLDFGEGGEEISVLGNFAGAGRDGEESETETTGGREVTRMRGRCAVGGETGDGIGAPEAMKFEAGEEGEGDGLDGGVFDEDGFAGGVATGDYAADIHQESPGRGKSRVIVRFRKKMWKRGRKKNAEYAESAEFAEKREELNG